MKETIVRKSREGIPCSPESLREHLEAFAYVEESISELYKKRDSVPMAASMAVTTKRTRTDSGSRSKSRKNSKVH